MVFVLLKGEKQMQFKKLPLFSGCAVITTYRCNAHCKMCNRHEHQSNANDEFKPELLLKLPHMHFINITGGEPFLREDIKQIVNYAHKRATRVVISTNGIMRERILEVMQEFPDTALRISLEGIGNVNNEIRGIPGGFESSIKLLKQLKEIGCKDVGISMTIHKDNWQDVMPLYELCKENGYDFATGVIHNSYFFENYDEDKERDFQENEEVIQTLHKLANAMYNSKNMKDRYRAVFNEELIKHLQGKKISFMPCNAAKQFFVIDPSGNVLSCVGSENQRMLGNIRHNGFFDVWNSKQADTVREECLQCNRNCCMSGNVALAMKEQAIELLPKVIG